MEVFALVVAVIFFLVGLAGTLLPVLPGAPLIWVGMFLYGVIAGFEGLSFWFYALQAALALAVLGTDYLFTAMGSRYFGGSKAAFWGAALGLLAGLFFFPVGLLVGPFLGAAAGEVLFGKKVGSAVKSGFGASLGFWTALPAKLGIEALMIYLFIVRII